MKKLIPLLFLMLCLGSCKECEGPTVCGTENPTEDLAWLKNLINEIKGNSFSKYNYIVQATYEGRTVFLVQNCCPFCATIVPVYDCEGNNLGYLTGENGINPEKLRGEKVIWKPENSECVFTQA
jgi:hypothetical protein